MLIASKLLPNRTDRTYFNSGRAAFAYLLQAHVRPRRIHLPAYTCWSLVSTLERRFPDMDVQFYAVDRQLHCELPAELDSDEAAVLIHFFGYENMAAQPLGSGTLLEDMSHAFLSLIPHRGDYVFGSLRKVARVADGGFIEGFYNPIYEPSRKLDTWLRYEAHDWRDMREAENMIDREWHLCDMSSQSLAVVLAIDAETVRRQRLVNERFLRDNLSVGWPLRDYQDHECPLLHQRLFATQQERDSLRSFLAQHNIFCSIHWPTHPLVRRSACDMGDAEWLEQHTLAIPVGSDYGEHDMARIVDTVEQWSRAGG